MAGVVHNPGQEFWQPPLAPAQTQEARMVEVCDRCGSEFVMGARYCHACGETRGAHPVASGAVRRYFEPLIHVFLDIKRALGLGTASLLAFVAGIVCVLAAAFTGIVYTVATTLDWQAVQVWRLEWLLGAAVAFIAGILLKKPQHS
ncbi:MAG TPA: hypothetical protein VKT29_02610 [Terriglobales bacterium]|nr:hypothetical protein [Terriglobales bacterium]